MSNSTADKTDDKRHKKIVFLHTGGYYAFEENDF